MDQAKSAAPALRKPYLVVNTTRGMAADDNPMLSAELEHCAPRPLLRLITPRRAPAAGSPASVLPKSPGRLETLSSRIHSRTASGGPAPATKTTVHGSRAAAALKPNSGTTPNLKTASASMQFPPAYSSGAAGLPVPV